MSRHSTPMDHKIQKDWADVMQQFELPADEIGVTNDKISSNIDITAKKPVGKKSTKVFLSFGAALAILATAYTGVDDKSFSFDKFNNLLENTIATSVTTNASTFISPLHEDNEDGDYLDDRKPLVTEISLNSGSDESLTEASNEESLAETASIETSSAEEHIAEKPLYVTLSKDLELSTIETLSVDNSALDNDLLDSKNWKTYIVLPKDKLSKILFKLGITKTERKELTKITKIKKELDRVKAGYILRAERKDGKLSQLITYNPPSKTSFVISQKDNKFSGKLEQKVIETRQNRTTLFISHSLRYDANQQNIPHSIVQKLTKIFDRDVKLTNDLKKGDRMTVVYEQIFHMGNKIADGTILAAELMHKDRAHRAIRFALDGNKADYFDHKGRDLSRSFVRHPIPSHTRVNSGFGKRRHPIYKRIRMHTGVDYAARRGTPVTATGNGIVKHVARKGGYGKTVIIKHSGGYTTLYGHLSKYKKNLKPGMKVYLGDVIGYVGSTGTSTGNHLHYEFRVNGVPKNPLKIELPKGLSLTAGERKKFKESSRNLIRQLDVLGRFAEENVDIKSGFGG